MSEILAWVPVVALGATAIVLFLSQRWRVSVIALSVQYLAAFWILLGLLPLGLAAVKLVVGWMSAALLGASHPGGEELGSAQQSNAWLIFRAASAALAMFGLLAIFPALERWIPTSAPIRVAGVLLAGLGLLQLGMSNRPLRVTLGLLTVLTGFEVLYSALERSVLVTGLLAVVQLGLTLAGVYLMGAMEEEPA